MTDNTTPRIYVGTYAKYNAGSIKGAWLDLDDYAGDKESFLEACRALHADESDPEFMFQDFDGFPKHYYSESSVPDALFEWLELDDDDDRELLAIYQDHVADSDATIEQARDAFCGKYDNPEDWAANFLDDIGALQEIPENLRYYFDYKAYARDARLNGDITFVLVDGDCWVFWNH